MLALCWHLLTTVKNNYSYEKHIYKYGFYFVGGNNSCEYFKMLFQSAKETISFKDSLHSFSTWTNYETPHDQALMLVAACQDFLTLSGVDKSVPILLQFQAWTRQYSDAANKWQCKKKKVFRTNLQHGSFRDNDEWIECRVSGYSCGFGSVFRLDSVIYELKGNSLVQSVLVAGLISVVMSWFSHFWSFSGLALARSRSRYIWRCCCFGDHLLLFLPLSWKSLLSGQLCLCSWTTWQDYFNTPPPQTQEEAGDSFLGFSIALFSQWKPPEAVPFVWSWELICSLSS